MPQWALHVEEEVRIWQKWNAYWIDRSSIVPVYFVRYEDLVTNPEPELIVMLSLALGIHP